MHVLQDTTSFIIDITHPLNKTIHLAGIGTIKAKRRGTVHLKSSSKSKLRADNY